MDYTLRYLTPEEASKALRISRSQISALKAAGAPVHYWGRSGRRYRIVLDEWIDWMDKAARDQCARTPRLMLAGGDMTRQRRDLLKAMAGG